MNSIYQVIIHGRTFESRNLKQLLARAVSEKRNLNRKILLQARSHLPGIVENSKEAEKPFFPLIIGSQSVKNRILDKFS